MPSGLQEGLRKWHVKIEGLFLRIGAVVQLAQFIDDALQGFDLLFRQAVGGNVRRVADAEEVVTGDAKERGQANQDVVGRQMDAVFIGTDDGLGYAEPIRQLDLGHPPLNPKFPDVLADDRVDHIQPPYVQTICKRGQLYMEMNPVIVDISFSLW